LSAVAASPGPQEFLDGRGSRGTGGKRITTDQLDELVPMMKMWVRQVLGVLATRLACFLGHAAYFPNGVSHR